MWVSKSFVRAVFDKILFLETFEDCLNFSEALLNILGINISGDASFFINVLQISITLLAYFGLFSAINCAVYTFSGDLENQLMSVLAAAYAQQIAFRRVALVSNSKKLRIFQQHLRYHISMAKNGKDKYYQQIITHYVTIIRPLFKLLLPMYLSAAIAFIVCPFLVAEEWVYPLNFIIPGTSPDTNPSYTFNYIYISFCVIISVTFYIGADCYAILLYVYLISRFELCSTYFSKVGDFTSEYNTIKKQSDLIRKAVNVHENTLSIFKIYKETQVSFVMIFIICLVQLISVLLLIILKNPFNHAYVPLVCAVGETFLYCLCGQVLSNKAIEISSAIYCSKWYKIKNIDDRKLLRFALARAQIPCVISAYGKLPLNMKTFSKIVNITYRFLAFLSKMM